MGTFFTSIQLGNETERFNMQVTQRFFYHLMLAVIENCLVGSN